MYISLRFLVQVAARMSSSTCPSTDKTLPLNLPTPRTLPRVSFRSSTTSSSLPPATPPPWVCAATFTMPRSFLSTSFTATDDCLALCSSDIISLRFRFTVVPTNGSAMKAWRMDMIVRRSLRNTDMVSSQHLRYPPSTPHTPRGDTQFCVSRNGTTSGVSSFIPFPKRQSKSTWTTDPVIVESRMFSPCLSPRPTTKPRMLHTAWDLTKLLRFCSQSLGSAAFLTNHSCNTGVYRFRNWPTKQSWHFGPCRSFIMRCHSSWPIPRSDQRSQTMGRMPLVLGTHSIRPYCSCKIVTQ
mmetsp:Transcript_49537/g.130576  ORF Transcript_49537/g.130576 Transcript_49537/m.130576 type:complete len:296 (-) Transcript_49537:2575-3462(-)